MTNICLMFSKITRITLKKGRHFLENGLQNGGYNVVGNTFFWNLRPTKPIHRVNIGGSAPLRPCPHDTFPNWARSIAPSSRPVARVHTGATGTLVPDPRDHLSTWNEWARSIAIGCALSNLSCGRSSGRYRPVSKSAAVGTRLLDLLLPLLGTRALSRVFNRLRHVKADTRTLISKVLQSSKPYSHTNRINK